MPHDGSFLYKYDDKANIFCYPNSDVLINSIFVTKTCLTRLSGRLTAPKIAELEINPIKGTYDLPHLRAIHKFIFSDIYDWVGQIRGGDFLTKGSSIFCRAMYIESLATEVHNKLKNDNFLHGISKAEFITKLAYYTGEINALHPSEKVNGHICCLYFKQLCNEAGYDLEYHKTQKEILIKEDAERDFVEEVNFHHAYNNPYFLTMLTPNLNSTQSFYLLYRGSEFCFFI